jgi:hypothetical protein
MLFLDTYLDWRDTFTMHSEWDGNTNTEYIDEFFPFMRTPSFLQKSAREINENPGFYQQLRKVVPYQGEKVLRNPLVTPEESNNYNFYSPVNEYLAKTYPFQCIRVLEDWTSSTPILGWNLGAGYRLDARCSLFMRQNYERAPHGYMNLNILFREKQYSHLPKIGASELVKFIKVLEQMPFAPRAVFYVPCGKDNWIKYGDPLKELDIEYVHTTDQLSKLWQRKLGGVQTSKICPVTKDYIWVATRYNPKSRVELPDEMIVPEIENVINSIKPN